MTSDDMQDDTSDMLRFLLKYYDWNWTKKLVFWLILRGFLFMPSDTLWVTPQDFARWKTLLRYIIHIRGKFHQFSICGCEVKNFQNFLYWSASIKWPFFGVSWAVIPPNIVRYSSLSPIRQTQFEKCFKNLHFGLNETRPKFTVWSILGLIFLPENQKCC